MIRRVINDRREATVPLRLRGGPGPELVVSAILDTGFTASLTLPGDLIASLGLPRQSSGGAILADGSVRQFDLYAAEVEWLAGGRPILVSAVGEEALLGMRLLAGCEVRMHVVPGGVVEIGPASSGGP